MSRTFSTNSGSAESLNVSLRCGCRSYRQSRHRQSDGATRLIVKPVEPKPREALAPLTDRVPADPEPICDQPVVAAGCRSQHDPCSQRQRLPGRTPSCQRLEFPPLIRRQYDHRPLSFAILASHCGRSECTEFS
jgi:hypothetical protein